MNIETKVVTEITSGDGTKITVKHYVDGGIMIEQNGERTFVPADVIETFQRAIVVPA